MRILITGGAGFIGSHLAERLLRTGHTVLTLDLKGRTQLDVIGYFDHTARHYHCTGDCREIKRDAFEYTEWVKPDFIYHLAATVGVRRVLEDPAECIDNNIRSLQAVLNLGIPGIFASTSEIYGLTKGPLAEGSPLEYSSKTRWAYAQSKIIGEHLARAAGWKSVRFFNVVGPRQNAEYGAVLPRFVQQALDGSPITVYGDGSQTRTFLDVRDCARILDTLREREFDVVNVGGPHTYSVNALASRVCGELDAELRINRVPYSSAYPEGFEECSERVPNLEKLHGLIGPYKYRDFSSTVTDLAESLKGVQEHEPVCR